MEPGVVNFNPPPCVFSNLNSDNFGRYTVHYDNTIVTDADDPVKVSSLRAFPFRKKLRFYGPTAESWSTGTLFVVYMCSIPAIDSLSIASYLPGSLTVSSRHAFNDD